MNQPETNPDAPLPRPSTFPDGLRVQVQGFDDQQAADGLGEQLTALFVQMGRYFDIQRLDGVTIAIDYEEALRSLDRGCATRELAPSRGRTVGVAMTPSVLRDGVLKSHVFVDAAVFFGMLKEDRYERAMQLLAHECAHVEVNAHYDRCFPDTLLRTKYMNAQQGARSEVILASWDEYAACALSAKRGENPEADYRETFLNDLADARERGNECIKAYRLHSQVGQIVREIREIYGGLMKHAAYYLGNAAGFGKSWRDDPAVAEALTEHWFLPFFERLETALAALYAELGVWPNHDGFEVIGDIGEDLMCEGGMYFYDSPDHPGEVGVQLPLTPDTVPY
ncbi:hypothetical protein FN976_11085 [Caenimonas sedimenti]|uniref:Uncharacterized protein n=1 Tax=Caenimonas sedimenti TaxID=2596921 RepID=A0A562ZS82_9BURK|nr:hypothetical protein [Caenimonas sedimenti]TWO71452.1 hypothetical protein FN976_11085 [Caenimonas sedimenti]